MTPIVATVEFDGTDSVPTGLMSLLPETKPNITLLRSATDPLASDNIDRTSAGLIIPVPRCHIGASGRYPDPLRHGRPGV